MQKTQTLTSGKMDIKPAFIKYKWAGLLAALFCIILTQNSKAQTFVSAPMTGTPAAGAYYNNVSIVLNPNFSFTSAPGQSLQLYISAPDCVPLQATLSANQNYVATYVPRVAGITNFADPNLGTCQVTETVQYVDFLGRPLQTVQVKGNTAATKDVVLPIAYDVFGRETTKYLPYTATGTAGSYRPRALTDVNGNYPASEQSTFYITPPTGVSSIASPFSQTAFEASPVNRPVEQGAPGTDWQLGAHTAKMDYQVNDVSTGYWAKRYVANIDANTGARSLIDQGTYDINQLSVSISKDENWVSANGKSGTAETYTDKEGHVVLKRVYNGTTALSTYYVYDDFGTLAFVLPPTAAPDGSLTSAANQTTLDNLCYQYRYDERGRMAQKKLPGKGWEYTVYNAIDKVVATQDANQRAINQWAIAKYDALGRPVISGLWNNGNTAISPTTLQSSVYAAAQWDATNNSTATGYTVSSYPLTLNTVLSISYYDDYSYTTGRPAAFTAPSGASAMTRGLATGTRTVVLNTIGNATPDMLWATTYYDDLGRATKSYAQHYLGGVLNANNYDAVSTVYNFTNQPTSVSRQHFNNTNTTTPLATVANQYVYDHLGRKYQTYEAINSPTNLLLSQTDYNDIGQVMTKHLHSTNGGTSFLQNIAYTYNERGWLLSSSAPLFQMQLQYNSVNNVSGINPVAQYNGNIASQSWGTSAAPNAKSYTYTYDPINRLTSGVSTDNYKESGITYDANGNILTLQRTANNTLIDNLSYTYNSTNQVKSIVDNAADNSTQGYRPGTYSGYQYDANGNMTVLPTPPDGTALANINISYNLHNLPQTITGGRTITYTYDAAGQKLRRVSPNTGSTDYIAGIQYDQSSGATAPSLSFIQTEEGKAAPVSGGGYDYYYYLTDNLGNTRLTFDTQGGTITTRQTDDYYPFGLEISRGTITSPKNEYLYNKKELQEELGQYDYGARFYDPVIARWNTVDPEVEKYERWSPYNYVLNNPIRNIDPFGDTVRVDPHSSKQFQEDYAKATALLHDKGQDEELTQLQNSTSVYIIKETEDTNGYFTPNYDSNGKPTTGGTISWNPTTGEQDKNGTSISPTTVLNHEFGHGAGYDSDPKAFMERAKTPDSKYGNKEEKRVIEGVEQRTARGLGEIGKDQITRTSHTFKYPLLVIDPTSNKGTPTIRLRNLQEVKVVGHRTKTVDPKKNNN